ncbi:amidase [Nocardioides sp. J2M5]|uniref:amidase n=1 Tax=Nocardioides palaemonis TaxID=2829810 RepID=UPI001BAD68BA|nr:amidase [Nocardioides palaemonis]MBS2937342.1 amidase [Nocardioides palaemonis]
MVLHDLTALEQGDAVRRGEVSPLELVEHYATRATDPTRDDVGAFVTTTHEQARDHARRLTEAGRPDGAGPLWGVPTGIKDLHPTAGVRTTFGSAAYDDFVPDESDELVRTVEAAGMPSLGKTSTPEFGSPCYTEPDVAPPSVTPWDTTRTAGGSSGGAGAAVAAGLLPLAPGSDGGGSIRIPASCCGLVGLKPTRGRVSGAPMYGDPTGLATPGTLARTVRDAAALLDVLEGRRVGDPFWAPAPTTSFFDACDREPGRLRVARFVTPVIADVDVHPSSVAAWEDASRLLASLGHEIEDVPVPIPRDAVADFETCWAVLTALSPAPPGREDRLRPLTRWLGDLGRQVSGPEFGLAIGRMRRHAAAALTALAAYDVVLTPTLARPPALVGELRDDADPARDFANQKAFTPWTSAWNVTGMPAVSLPLHWTDDGLPVGVMLAARPAEEELLLSVAAQVEQAAPWVDRHPPGW